VPDQNTCALGAAQARSDLAGLSVTLPDRCKCGENAAVIVEVASLQCKACGARRGWLPREACSFLCGIVKTFGRPTTAIRLSLNNAGGVFPPSSRPFSAAAATQLSLALE
jgi:hypothetical protein